MSGEIRMSRIYDVACARCGDEWNTADSGPLMTLRKTEALLRRNGWRKRWYGWVCERCIRSDE